MPTADDWKALKAARESHGLSQQDALDLLAAGGITKKPAEWSDSMFKRAKRLITNSGAGWRQYLNHKRDGCPEWQAHQAAQRGQGDIQS